MMRIARFGKFFIIPEVIFAHKCYCFILVWFQNGFIGPVLLTVLLTILFNGGKWWFHMIPIR